MTLKFNETITRTVTLSNAKDVEATMQLRWSVMPDQDSDADGNRGHLEYLLDSVHFTDDVITDVFHHILTPEEAIEARILLRTAAASRRPDLIEDKEVIL